MRLQGNKQAWTLWSVIITWKYKDPCRFQIEVFQHIKIETGKIEICLTGSNTIPNVSAGETLPSPCHQTFCGNKQNCHSKATFYHKKILKKVKSFVTKGKSRILMNA